MKKVKNIFKGKSYAERGERRYALLVWQFVAVAMLGLTLIVIYRDGRIMHELSQQQYTVFEVDRQGRVSAHAADEYQVGPLQVEIEGRAQDAVKWIVKADSTNVDTAREEAKKLMTEDMAREFDAQRGDAWAEKIKKLNIYRIIDELHSRPLTGEDLPPEKRNKFRITKYDTVVYGKVSTYRRGKSEWLDESWFAYHVALQPQEARTKENMSAVLVNMMADLNIEQINSNNRKLEESGSQSSDSEKENKNQENQREQIAVKPTEEK